MKLSDMVAKKTGLPDGFSGSRMKWDEISEPFEIVKAAILSRPLVAENGEVILFEQGPKAGQPIPDRQLVLQIRTKSGKSIIVRTNSPRLVPLFTADLDAQEPVGKNQYGDDIYAVEAPEGMVRFVAFNYPYKNGKKGDVADLEEVEE